MARFNIEIYAAELFLFDISSVMFIFIFRRVDISLIEKRTFFIGIIISL